jgi:DNA-binding XRE family transcriptional regulator
MAKGKFKYWLTKEGLLKLEAWARDGLKDEDISKKLDINRTTLYDWKNKYPDISDALKKGKEIVDIEVENSLLSNALGFEYEEEIAFKCKKVFYDMQGRKCEEEEIKIAKIKRYKCAETTADIFWLKNRKPGVWRDKQDIEIPNGININTSLEDKTSRIKGFLDEYYESKKNENRKNKTDV